MNYSDDQGRVFKARLTIGAVKRIQDATGVSLFKLDEGEPPLIQRLLDDPVELFDVIACLFGEQFKANEIDVDDWITSNIGGVRPIFFDELIRFFHQCGQSHRAKALTSAVALYNEMSERTEAAADEMAGIISEQSTSSPATLGSTLTT